MRIVRHLPRLFLAACVFAGKPGCGRSSLLGNGGVPETFEITPQREAGSPDMARVIFDLAERVDFTRPADLMMPCLAQTITFGENNVIVGEVVGSHRIDAVGLHYTSTYAGGQIEITVDPGNDQVICPGEIEIVYLTAAGEAPPPTLGLKVKIAGGGEQEVAGPLAPTKTAIKLKFDLSGVVERLTLKVNASPGGITILTLASLTINAQ